MALDKYTYDYDYATLYVHVPTLNRLPHSEHSKQRGLAVDEAPADDVIDDVVWWSRWWCGSAVGLRRPLDEQARLRGRTSTKR